MSAAAPNAASRAQPSLSGNQKGIRNSRVGAVAAWLRETYRPVIVQNPTPALAFMACFFGIMFGILLLMV